MATDHQDTVPETLQGDLRDISERLGKIEENQTELSIKLAKKKGFSLAFDGDENEDRGNWTGKFDFFLSCLGYAVGIGNVWRFPYLCYKNGGGAFLIPYCIFLFLCGMPIFCMELAIGQFSSAGPLKCWECAPLFRGIGMGMVLVSSLAAIYYNVVITWALWYLFASFTAKLPWSECGSWSTQFCSEKLKTVTTDCNNWSNLTKYDNGTCWYVAENATSYLYGIYNTTLAKGKFYRLLRHIVCAISGERKFYLFPLIKNEQKSWKHKESSVHTAIALYLP